MWCPCICTAMITAPYLIQFDDCGGTEDCCYNTPPALHYTPRNCCHSRSAPHQCRAQSSNTNHNVQWLWPPCRAPLFAVQNMQCTQSIKPQHRWQHSATHISSTRQHSATHISSTWQHSATHSWDGCRRLQLRTRAASHARAVPRTRHWLRVPAAGH